MAFGPHLHAFWLLSICTVALYVLLALAFPGGVTKCGDTLAHRPGITLLTGVLGGHRAPVVFILLLVTVVGIPIALVVLPISIVCRITFGKAAMYALSAARSWAARCTRPCRAPGRGHRDLFYLVPLLGGLVWILIAFLGFSCAVTTIFTLEEACAPGGDAARVARRPLPPRLPRPWPPRPSMGRWRACRPRPFRR
jgi:hypothetical protein